MNEEGGPEGDAAAGRAGVALSISSFLSFQIQRLDALDVSDPRVPEAARKANVLIIDISSVSTDDTFRIVASSHWPPRTRR